MNIILLLILLLTSCFASKAVGTQVSNEKELLLNEIFIKLATQLKREKNLDFSGSAREGVDNINNLALSFEYYKPVEIEEARALMVDAAHVLLKAINDEERIRPYLKDYPFLVRNVEISISFQNKNGLIIEGEKLELILMIEGVLAYKFHNPEPNDCFTLYQETFEEAEERVKNKTFRFKHR